MKNSLLILTLCGFLLPGCMKKTSLKSEEDKTFYTVGAMFGTRLRNLGLSDRELDVLTQGLRDTAKGEKPAVEIAQYQKNVQKIFKERMSKNTGKTKEKGKIFLEDFVSKEGGKKTKSGLAYKVIKKGRGKRPKTTDIVEVHYHGTLIDGQVFDSSVDRKKKISFPLNRVIKGWSEGLQLMKEGGKMKLVIPSNLAYGDQGAPPKIPGGSTLVFEVELFSIKKGAKVKGASPSFKKGLKFKKGKKGKGKFRKKTRGKGKNRKGKARRSKRKGKNDRNKR